MSHMQQEEFEKRIKAQLDQTSMTPPEGSWEQLERMLTPEKKNRKGLFFLSGMVLLGLFGAYFLFESIKKSEKIVLPTNKVSERKNDLTAGTGENLPQVLSHDYKKSKAGASVTRHAEKRPPLNTQPLRHKVDLYYSIGEAELYIPRKNILLITPNIQPLVPETYRGRSNPGSLILDDEAPEALFDPNDSNTRFMIGASAYIIGTYRHLRTMGQASEIEKSQVALRNQIEQINIDFNGGLFFKIKVHRNWYAGTGIYIYNCSERINFALKQNVPDKPAPAISMSDIYIKNNLNNPSVFKLQGDSIYAGHPASDKMNTLVNQYYFNEIPLSLTWFKSGKKYNWFAEGGLSGARLTVINASLVELDQIGFTGVTDRVNYSGISSWILNATAGAGIGINLNRNFHIDVSAEFKYAMTPLMNFGYARQNPYALGGGIVFARRF